MPNLHDIRKIYFIGIGGIGMSALARYFRRIGAEVHGYDRTSTELTRTLEAEGMTIHYTDDVSAIPEGIDLVVFTPAVPTGFGELIWFRERGFEVLKRSEVLGIISRGMKTMAVAGTHGKTTTSSMLTHILRVGGVDCTAFLGGIARNYGANYIEGNSNVVVVEADEYDRSFMRLHPDVTSIMSMDADHLDIYGDEATMQHTYAEYAAQVKDGGTVIMRFGLPLKKLDAAKGRVKFETFGISRGQHRATNIRVRDGFFMFDFKGLDGEIPNIKMSLPGRHNIENATAATAIALKQGVSPESVREALLSFKGIKRRFDIVFRDQKRVYIDDYAHHPTELASAIGAAKELFKGRKITGVFQPHLFSRTRDFAEGFATSLDMLDEVILLDIYPARELPIEGVTAMTIFDKMTSDKKVQISKDALLQELQHRHIDVLMTLGAGDIDTFVAPIRAYLSNI